MMALQLPLPIQTMISLLGALMVVIIFSPARSTMFRFMIER